MNDPVVRVLEQAKEARTEAEVNAIDDSALTRFLMEHLQEWVVPLTGTSVDQPLAEPVTGIPPGDIEDCAAQISQSLLMRLSAP